jgi:hypothetical protein
MAANHEAHVLTTLALDAALQTANCFTEESASFVLCMHTFELISGVVGSIDRLYRTNHSECKTLAGLLRQREKIEQKDTCVEV